MNLWGFIRTHLGSLPSIQSPEHLNRSAGQHLEFTLERNRKIHGREAWVRGEVFPTWDAQAQRLLRHWLWLNSAPRGRRVVWDLPRKVSHLFFSCSCDHRISKLELGRGGANEIVTCCRHVRRKWHPNRNLVILSPRVKEIFENLCCKTSTSS